MSWEAACFLILAGALLAGFAWYERSRPPAQVLALVAALAALAIAGRIAFAAFPNVKPTTDIVIFAGFALGGPAGFAVGALTALVSNFWFGQGPWTPWQMAGWGMCGLIGAALARGGREPNRFVLATVCALAGLAYGALLNFSLMATYGGDLSLRHFLVLESRAAPFDAAHAIGNFAFALVAGPAMIRMLARFRERFVWRAPAATGTATLLAAVVLLGAALPAPATAGPAQAGSWLVRQQNSDGGFGSSPGTDSNTSTTAWVMLGLEASGRNPLDVSRSGRTAVDYLRRNVTSLSSPGDLARTILALEGAGVDPRSFGGRDLVDALLKRRRSDGSYEGWPASTSFAVIALRAAGAGGGLSESQAWLGGAQNEDGGWGDVPGGPSNADVTGAAMQAMPDSKAARRGLTYLRDHQRNNGGFGLGAGGPANTQSTAWAVQGMIAVGADPGSIRAGGDSALDFIAGLQEADGHYRYSGSSDQTPVWVTGEVLVAASREVFPVAVAPRIPEPPPPPPPAPTPSIDPGAFESVPVPESAIPPPAAPPASIPESSIGPSPAPPGGGTAGRVPAVPGGGAAVPPASGVVPTLPEVAPEKPDLVPATPTSAIEADDDDPASPWIPIGIGAGVTLLALVTPLALGRRYAW
jgi:Prenyltransferase and squalene oxidase repeat